MSRLHSTAFLSLPHILSRPIVRRYLAPFPSHRTPSMRAMRFRPCIDLHAGRVKQIVGGTLTDAATAPTTNFETDLSPAYYAELYHRDKLPGGHVIMLGPGNEIAARKALNVFPDGMHVGGGMNPSNAGNFINAGASHVIVTSYVFREGVIVWERVQEMLRAVGKRRLVLDVSCRKRNGEYFVCTDRWQKWTDFALNAKNFDTLGQHCDEILVHAVDVEGKKSGIDLDLVEKMAAWASVPVTYAGGVRSIADMELAKEKGRGLTL
ncbi:unnamed protein product [Chondrus crispus]|uniref:1-(5-phosphoribosyl)-5-[(5-phosphoribosylamino)methylideneamino]imidazole-4-carboxamideisomerase n=1 Tax=Chondrus crispus TaxID=2769 RepID=R7Q4A9_CHOCR|nr:unnamed protein product [Chondrus crispus]CDF32708.1 unnamed protein product [Chondrus crispus]|eukprot:XP_005712479.1 unnamed protein product [Chondrus crispus]